MATTPSATPPSTPTIHCPVNYENLNESWFDIKYKSGCSSSGSISHLHHTVNPEILEKLLQEAQRESTTPSHSTTYPNLNENLFMLPESCVLSSKTDAYMSHSDILDTSTPMLVTFDNVSIPTSPIVNIPASPINKIDKSLTSLNNIVKTQVECSMCFTHKKQIQNLLEKQKEHETQLITLRNEYQEKCLSKTPDFMCQSSRSSISSICEDQDLTDNKNSQVEEIVSTMKRQNSSTATLVSTANKKKAADHNDLISLGSYASGIYNYNSNNFNSNVESADWMKYWSSRPQTQPPKNWNFVHPNSSKSKYNNVHKTENDADKSIIAKYINCDSVSKLIFTHMASFIVGATLMFIVIRRHLNLRTSIYMK